jgi:hypothetical protein
MTKFAKRHYVAIANALAASRPSPDFHGGAMKLQWDNTVYMLSNMFRADNGMFKPDRFREACEKE